MPVDLSFLFLQPTYRAIQTADLPSTFLTVLHTGSHLEHLAATLLLVEQYIQEEVESFRLLGPIPPFLATTHHTSLIPSPTNLVNGDSLSAPAGTSINDVIYPDLCLLHDASSDDATLIVQKLCIGTVLAKLDPQGSILQGAHSPR